MEIWRVYDLGLQSEFTVNVGWNVSSIFGFISVAIVIVIIILFIQVPSLYLCSKLVSIR